MLGRVFRHTPRKLIDIRETLREDYEFYLNDEGEFFVSYKASCDRCGFKYSFKHSEQVKT